VGVEPAVWVAAYGCNRPWAPDGQTLLPTYAHKQNTLRDPPFDPDNGRYLGALDTRKESCDLGKICGDQGAAGRQGEQLVDRREVWATFRYPFVPTCVQDETIVECSPPLMRGIADAKKDQSVK
jgi:hypothetical protein